MKEAWNKIEGIHDVKAKESRTSLRQFGNETLILKSSNMCVGNVTGGSNDLSIMVKCADFTCTKFCPMAYTGVESHFLSTRTFLSGAIG